MGSWRATIMGSWRATTMGSWRDLIFLFLVILSPGDTMAGVSLGTSLGDVLGSHDNEK